MVNTDGTSGKDRNRGNRIVGKDIRLNQLPEMHSAHLQTLFSTRNHYLEDMLSSSHLGAQYVNRAKTVLPFGIDMQFGGHFQAIGIDHQILPSW